MRVAGAAFAAAALAQVSLWVLAPWERGGGSARSLDVRGSLDSESVGGGLGLLSFGAFVFPLRHPDRWWNLGFAAGRSLSVGAMAGWLAFSFAQFVDGEPEKSLSNFWVAGLPAAAGAFLLTWRPLASKVASAPVSSPPPAPVFERKW